MRFGSRILCCIRSGRRDGTFKVKTLLEEIEKMYLEFQKAGWKETNPNTLLVPSIVTKRKKDAERILKLRQKYKVSNTVIWQLSAIETASEMGRALKEDTKGYELFRELTEELFSCVEEREGIS